MPQRSLNNPGQGLPPGWWRTAFEAGMARKQRLVGRWWAHRCGPVNTNAQFLSVVGSLNCRPVLGVTREVVKHDQEIKVSDFMHDLAIKEVWVVNEFFGKPFHGAKQNAGNLVQQETGILKEEQQLCNVCLQDQTNYFCY